MKTLEQIKKEVNSSTVLTKEQIIKDDQFIKKLVGIIEREIASAVKNNKKEAICGCCKEDFDNYVKEEIMNILCESHYSFAIVMKNDSDVICIKIDVEK
jgi:hypothetical protein